MAKTEKTLKSAGQTKKKAVTSKVKTRNSSVRMTSPLQKGPAASKKKAGTGIKTTGSKKVKSKTKISQSPKRYKCRICGYIYSPLRGEPQHGIPVGTEFEDLPDDYVCPLCGFHGKGKIGAWGFDDWHPTKYICAVCGYVYDEKRGEPLRGIKPGTKFEDLPDDYVCPVCALDPKIDVQFGKVLKQGFGPLYIP